MSNVVSLQCATPKYVNFVHFDTYNNTSGNVFNRRSRSAVAVASLSAMILYGLLSKSVWNTWYAYDVLQYKATAEREREEKKKRAYRKAQKKKK